MLSLATTLTIHVEARLLALPIAAAVEVVLKGLRDELVRRWRAETEGAIVIELPRLDRSARAQFREQLQLLEDIYRDQLRSSEGIQRPFLEDGMRLTKTLRLAVVELVVMQRAPELKS